MMILVAEFIVMEIVIFNFLLKIGPADFESNGNVPHPNGPLLSIRRGRCPHSRCRWRKAKQKWHKKVEKGLGETEKVV